MLPAKGLAGGCHVLVCVWIVQRAVCCLLSMSAGGIALCSGGYKFSRATNVSWSAVKTELV